MLAEIVTERRTVADVLLLIAAVVSIIDFVGVHWPSASPRGSWLALAIGLVAIALMFL